MNDPQPTSPRARLQELLAIPERQRTDAEWDELNELEIMFAAGKRETTPQQNARGNAPATGGDPRSGGRPHYGKGPSRKFHQRPRKPR
jgi:hypothetical protein